MGSPTYRATDGGLTFDAFYRDEWGVANTSANCEPKDAAARDGWHKNLFTTVKTTGGSVVEEPATFDEPFKNAADPNLNKGLKNKANPVPPSAKRDFTMSFYCSDDVTAYAKGLAGKPWTKPINLTVYFGVGSELNRHGIRSFFKNQANMQVFLQVEGIEKPQFGVAPTDMDIKRALGRFFKVDPIPYRVKVLAAFSTGSCGLNQALLNELIDVASVERLVFYDCLYSQQCGNTATAIRMLKAKVGGNLKIVVYKASECANSFEEKPGVCPPGLRTKCGFIPPPGKCLDFNRLSVVVNNQGLIDPNGIIGNLFQNTSYIAMVVFRALQGAVDDGVIKLSPINAKPWNDMAALMAASPRGLTISNKTCFKYVHGSVPASGYTLFEDWSATNRTVINAFVRRIGSVATPDTFRALLWGNLIPGWGGGDGEEKHDLLIPEFGWEYLPY